MASARKSATPRSSPRPSSRPELSSQQLRSARRENFIGAVRSRKADADFTRREEALAQIDRADSLRERKEWEARLLQSAPESAELEWVDDQPNEKQEGHMKVQHGIGGHSSQQTGGPLCGQWGSEQEMDELVNELAEQQQSAHASVPTESSTMPSAISRVPDAGDIEMDERS